MSSNDPGARVVRLETEEPEEGVASGDEVTRAVDVPQPSAEEPRWRRRLFRLPRISVSRVGLGVWLGLLIAAGGFGLIAFTWGKVAGLVDVYAQLPYFVSGGLVGLGLILVGLTVVNLTVKRKDALDRQRQLEELRDAMVSLRSAIESAEEDGES
jgi:hypothetical protein